MSLANGRVGTDLYIVLGIGATRSDQTDPEVSVKVIARKHCRKRDIL